jgi:hypothetical protein
MTARLDASATVTSPPASATVDPTHEAGVVFRVANNTASGFATAVDIPKNCRGRYWRFLTRGPDVNTPVDVQWGWLFDTDGIGGVDTAPTLILNQLSVTGTGAVAAQPTLLDRTPEHFYCPRAARRVVFISSASSGFFEASLSGERTGAL